MIIIVSPRNNAKRVPFPQRHYAHAAQRGIRRHQTSHRNNNRAIADDTNCRGSRDETPIRSSRTVVARLDFSRIRSSRIGMPVKRERSRSIAREFALIPGLAHEAHGNANRVQRLRGTYNSSKDSSARAFRAVKSSIPSNYRVRRRQRVVLSLVPSSLDEIAVTLAVDVSRPQQTPLSRLLLESRAPRCSSPSYCIPEIETPVTRRF